MKRCLAFLVGFFVFTGTALGAFPEVKVQKINERVYALLGPTDVPNKANGGYINNNLVILGEKGVILVDAGSHHAVARHILAALRGVTDKPVTHVLITHAHSDHHLGLSAFPGAQVISTETCARTIAARGRGMVNWMKGRSGLDLASTKPVVPQTTLPAGTRQTMRIDGVQVELIAAAKAHTDGDMIVWLPEDKVLASGDILVSGINPNFGDGDLKSWIRVAQDILELPFETVLPGHGPLMNREDVKEFTGLIGDFYRTVESVYKAGGAESDIRNKLDLSRWQRLERFDDMMGHNINTVWLQVEADNF